MADLLIFWEMIPETIALYKLKNLTEAEYDLIKTAHGKTINGSAGDECWSTHKGLLYLATLMGRYTENYEYTWKSADDETWEEPLRPNLSKEELAAKISDPIEICFDDNENIYDVIKLMPELYGLEIVRSGWYL